MDKPILSLGQIGVEGRQKKFRVKTFMCLLQSLKTQVIHARRWMPLLILAFPCFVLKFTLIFDIQTLNARKPWRERCQVSRTNVCRMKNAMKLGICSCKKRLVKNGVKFVLKSSGHFRPLFPEERGAAKFHQKFHGIFHGNFYARFQEIISRQHFCTPCRDAKLPSSTLWIWCFFGRRISSFVAGALWEGIALILHHFCKHVGSALERRQSSVRG